MMDLSTSHSGTDIANILCLQAPCSGTIAFENSIYSLSRSSCDLQSIKLIPRINPNNYLFHNMSLMDNITIEIPKTKYTSAIWNSKSINKFLYKNALSLIHCEHLYNMFDHYDTLTHVDNLSQLQILFARAVCSKASLIVLNRPYDSYSSLNISDFKSLFKAVCALGIGILIISSNFPSLRDSCSRICVFDNGKVPLETKDSQIGSSTKSSGAKNILKIKWPMQNLIFILHLPSIRL